MFNNPIHTPPRWWQPKHSPFWVKALRPFRQKRQRRVFGLREVDVAEAPSIERIAETIVKFEEDVLGRWDSPPRAAKRATVVFGEPIDVGQFAEEKGRKQAGPLLTRHMEERVQSLIDNIEPPTANRERSALSQLNFRISRLGASPGFAAKTVASAKTAKCASPNF